MAKINRIGGSFKITLPKQVCDLLGWQEHDDLQIKMDDQDNILIINISLKEQKHEKKDFFN